MFEYKLEKKSEKLKVVNTKLLDTLNLDLFSPQLITKLLSEKKVEISEFFVGQSLESDLRKQTILDYISKTSKVSIYEKVFMVYKTVQLYGNHYKTPLFLIPISINVDKMLFELDGYPIINELLEESFYIKKNIHQTLFDLDSIELNATLKRAGAKIYDEAFVSAYDLSVTLESTKVFFSKIKINKGEFLVRDDLYFRLDEQKINIIEELRRGKNLVALGDNSSGKTNLIINAVIRLIKDKKRVLLITKNKEVIMRHLAKFDLLNLTYDYSKNRHENQEIYETHIEKIDDDNLNYSRIKHDLIKTEEAYLYRNNGFQMNELIHFAYVNQNYDKLDITPHNDINFNDLSEIKYVLDNVEKLIEQIDFKADSIDESYLSFIKDDFYYDTTAFFNLLKNVKNLTAEITDELEQLKNVYQFILPNDLSELAEILKFNKKFNLNLYPRSFYQAYYDNDLERIQSLYASYNSKLSKMNSYKEMLDSNFKQEIFKYDFEKLKDLLFGDMFRKRGIDFVESLIKNSDYITTSMNYFLENIDDFKSLVDYFKMIFEKSFSIDTILTLQRVISKTSLYNGFLESDKLAVTSDIVKLKKDYETLSVYFDSHALTDEDKRFADFKKYRTSLYESNKKQADLLLKTYLKDLKNSNVAGKKLLKLFEDVEAYELFQLFLNEFGSDKLKRIIIWTKIDPNKLKTKSNDIINLYYKIIDHLDPLFFSTSLYVDQFIDENLDLIKEYNDLLVAIKDFSKLSLSGSVYSLKKIFYTSDAIRGYLSGQNYLLENKKEINEVFGNYFDLKTASFKNVKNALLDFKTVISYFEEITHKSNENRDFYSLVKRLSNKVNKLNELKEELFEYLYLDSKKYQKIANLHELVSSYNHKLDIQNYLKLNDFLKVLRRYGEYFLVANIKNGSATKDLNKRYELELSKILINKHFVKTNTPYSELNYYDNLSVVRFKNEIYDFLNSHDIKKLICQRAKSGLKKDALISVADSASILLTNDDYDYALIADGHNILKNDLFKIERKARAMLLTGYKNNLITFDDSIAGYAKGNLPYQELIFDSSVFKEKVENKIKFHNEEASISKIVDDLKKYGKINILVSSPHERSEIYLKISAYLLKEEKDLFDSLIKKLYVSEIDYSIIYKAEKSIIILKSRYTDEQLVQIFKKILLLCGNIDVYDNYKSLNNAKRDMILNLGTDVRGDDFSELEERFITKLKYDVQKANHPVNIVIEHLGIKLGIKFCFQKNYQKNQIFQDIQKIYNRKINNLDHVILVDLYELYIDEDKVIEKIDKIMGGFNEK